MAGGKLMIPFQKVQAELKEKGWREEVRAAERLPDCAICGKPQRKALFVKDYWEQVFVVCEGTHYFLHESMSLITQISSAVSVAEALEVSHHDMVFTVRYQDTIYTYGLISKDLRKQLTIEAAALRQQPMIVESDIEEINVGDLVLPKTPTRVEEIRLHKTFGAHIRVDTGTVYTLEEFLQTFTTMKGRKDRPEK